MNKDLQRRLAKIEQTARLGIGYIRLECGRHETNAEALRRVFGDAGPPAGVPVMFFEGEPTAEQWEADGAGASEPQSDELRNDRAGRNTFWHHPGACTVIRIGETMGVAA